MKRDFTVIEKAEKISSNGNHLPTGKQISFSSGHRNVLCIYSAGLKIQDFAPYRQGTNLSVKFPDCIRGTHFSTENKSAFLEYSKQVNATGMGCKVFFSLYKEMLQG